MNKVKNIHRDNDGKLPYFAFPGGYPIVYLDSHNEVLCPECANEKDQDPEEWEDWKPKYWFIYYEGPMLFCDECNNELEPAYGDPEEDK